MNVSSNSLDSLGRVMDFSEIKRIPCEWLENNWDHRFLLWEQDPLAATLPNLDPTVVLVPFNPTAENMARHICNLFPFLISVTVQETAKCSATYERD